MYDPNLQQIPRGASEEEKWVKDCFRTPEGYSFVEMDFSGIEAKLVGYFSGSRTYTWLTGIDVHSFYTIHALHALDGTWSANDLPQTTWDEDKLRKCLKEIKREFGQQRNGLYKHLVHGANYLQSPRGARDHIFKVTNVGHELRTVAKVMGVYFELFPEIKKWHYDICRRVDGTKKREADGPVDPWTMGVCYARNPFGYVHRFYSVLEWEKIGTEWVSSFGDDAKRLVSFLPQSTAAAIIKQAARVLYYQYPNVGECLRLLIHDSIMMECRDDQIEECLETGKKVMEAPIAQLPLDPDWQMGEFLSIGTESKVGKSWGEM